MHPLYEKATKLSYDVIDAAIAVHKHFGSGLLESIYVKALVRNITRTLTELGGGFAYVGHQVRVNVGGKDFWPDLIFYHLKTQRYLVIELKAGEFMPEHVGQLGFYMTAVDRQIKNDWDKPTIGLVLCREGNRTIIEYALNTTNMPMGVGKYALTKEAPLDIKDMNESLARLPPVVDATLSKSDDACG